LALSYGDTVELLDLIEHLFDRLGYAESKLQKVRGAVEATEYWVIQYGDQKALHSGQSSRKGAAAQESVGKD